MGTLYSRCIGSLNAKGKYIFSLDNDDMFFNSDIFDTVYKISEQGNFDVVEFKKYYIQKSKFDLNNIKKYKFNKQKDLILHQPHLGIYPISKNGRFKHNDYLIWDKCIKSEIYKKSVNYLGKDIYKKISWNEDIIIIFIIFNISKSFKYINKYGILKILSNSSASCSQTQNEKLFGDICLLNTIFKFSNENKMKNFAVDYLMVNKRFNYKYMNIQNKIYLLSILRKMIDSKYITENNKNFLKKKLANYIIHNESNYL